MRYKEVGGADAATHATHASHITQATSAPGSPGRSVSKKAHDLMNKLSPRSIGLLVGLSAIVAAAGIPRLINQAEAADLVGPLTIVTPGTADPLTTGSGDAAFGLRFPDGI